jgi:hypothetical protein
MEITGLKMLKLVALRLVTQADMTFHIRECYSQHGRRDYSNCTNGANRVSVAKYSVLKSFVFIGRVLQDLGLLIVGSRPSESPCTSKTGNVRSSIYTRCVLRCFVDLIGLDIHLLQAQIYSCEVKTIQGQ